MGCGLLKMLFTARSDATDFTCCRKIKGIEERRLPKPVCAIKNSHVRAQRKRLWLAIGAEILDGHGLQPDRLSHLVPLSDQGMLCRRQLDRVREIPVDAVLDNGFRAPRSLHHNEQN